MIILKQSCSALWAWLYKEVKRNWEQADYSRKLFIASWFLTNNERITTVRFHKKKENKLLQHTNDMQATKDAPY